MKTIDNVINEFENKGLKYGNVFVRTEIFTRNTVTCLMKEYAKEQCIEFIKDMWGYDLIELNGFAKGMDFDEMYNHWITVKELHDGK